MRYLLILLLTTVSFASISTTTQRVTYTGDDADTTFDFSFQIQQTSDIEVRIRTTATGAEDLQTETTEYSISATNNNYSSGGTVTMVTAPASTETILIIRKTPETQETSLSDSGRLRLRAIENALDKLTRMIQDHTEQLARTPKIPKTDDTSLTMEAVNSVDRASSFLFWGNDGSLSNSTSGISDATTVSTYGATLVDDATAAAARTTLLLTDGSADLAVDQLIMKDPYMDVRAHLPSGYVTDGTQDYTTEFGTAKTAAVAAGVPLFIPAGTWKASISVLDADDDLKIIGVNREDSILDAPNNATATIGIASGAEDINIRNLRIVNSAATNNGTHYGVGAVNAARLILVDVKLDGYNININVTESVGVRLVRVLSQNADDTGGGVNGSGVYIIGPVAQEDGTDTYITNSQFLSNKYGIYLEDQELPSITNVNCSQNDTYGMYILGRATVNAGFSIVSCEFDSNGSGGLLIKNMQWGHISNVWAGSTDGFGVKFDKVLYAGCHGMQTVNSTANTVHGLWLTGGSLYNTFTSGTSHNNTGIGVLIDDNSYGNTFSSYVVKDNGDNGFEFNDTTADRPNQLSGCLSEGHSGGDPNNYALQKKDDNRGGGMIHGTTASYTFAITDIADEQTDENFDALGISGNIEFTAPHGGSIVGLDVALNDARTAGTLTVTPAVNGTADTDIQIVFDGTPSQYGRDSAFKGRVPFDIDDRISLEYTTDAPWEPDASVDAVATITVIFD